MVKIGSYSIYCLYTDKNDIYIGLSKNPWVRIQQHKKKSCNFRLRELYDAGRTEIFAEVLHKNLTKEQASNLEKILIRKYRNDPDYTVLNIQSGGIRGNSNIDKVPKVETDKSTKHLKPDEVVKLRHKYCAVAKPIKFSTECKHYNLTKNYFVRILRGTARRELGGPLLGKDYENG